MRARLGTWPHDPEVAHLVLLDHHMVPTSSDVRGWINEARLKGASTIRTGALFPKSVGAFEEAGFREIDRLVLLRHSLAHPTPRLRPQVLRSSSDVMFGGRTDASREHRIRRLRTADLGQAAAIDQRSFDNPWNNDRQSLENIRGATPHHRSRFVSDGDRILAFAISGRTSSSGYVQRLAVDPSARRRGLGRALVIDALGWMRRRGATTAMVNTAADNHAAAELYKNLGFTVRNEHLTIFEYPVSSDT